jgi:hypothetical protein
MAHGDGQGDESDGCWPRSHPRKHARRLLRSRNQLHVFRRLAVLFDSSDSVTTFVRSTTATYMATRQVDHEKVPNLTAAGVLLSGRGDPLLPQLACDEFLTGVRESAVRARLLWGPWFSSRSRSSGSCS